MNFSIWIFLFIFPVLFNLKLISNFGILNVPLLIGYIFIYFNSINKKKIIFNKYIVLFTFFIACINIIPFPLYQYNFSDSLKYTFRMTSMLLIYDQFTTYIKIDKIISTLYYIGSIFSITNIIYFFIYDKTFIYGFPGTLNSTQQLSAFSSVYLIVSIIYFLQQRKSLLSICGLFFSAFLSVSLLISSFGRTGFFIIFSTLSFGILLYLFQKILFYKSLDNVLLKASFFRFRKKRVFHYAMLFFVLILAFVFILKNSYIMEFFDFIYQFWGNKESSGRSNFTALVIESITNTKTPINFFFGQGGLHSISFFDQEQAKFCINFDCLGIGGFGDISTILVLLYSFGVPLTLLLCLLFFSLMGFNRKLKNPDVLLVGFLMTMFINPASAYFVQFGTIFTNINYLLLFSYIKKFQIRHTAPKNREKCAA